MFPPPGHFVVRIPVLPELGGGVKDTVNVVTFQDAFNTHISIAAFRQDATQQWQLSTSGIKDYLTFFFNSYVRPDFTRTFKDARVESSGRFIPTVQGGAFIAYVLIPGGSMFAARTPPIEGDTSVPVAKRGNMLFVKNGFIFVISTELAERVTEGSTYKMTSDDEDKLLRDRLVDIASRINYLNPNSAQASGTTPAATSSSAPTITFPVPAK